MPETEGYSPAMHDDCALQRCDQELSILCKDASAGEDLSGALAFAAGAGLVAVFSVWALRSLRRAEAAG